jgi:hypothetical protein
MKTIVKKLEKDLNIYDVWESPNGNVFIKLSDNYSIAIGAIGYHDPVRDYGGLESSNYVKSDDVTPVKKIGKIIFK